MFSAWIFTEADDLRQNFNSFIFTQRFKLFDNDVREGNFCWIVGEATPASHPCFVAALARTRLGSILSLAHTSSRVKRFDRPSAKSPAASTTDRLASRTNLKSSSSRSAESTTATGRPWLVRITRCSSASAASLETPFLEAVVTGMRSDFIPARLHSSKEFCNGLLRSMFIFVDMLFLASETLSAGEEVSSRQRGVIRDHGKPPPDLPRQPLFECRIRFGVTAGRYLGTSNQALLCSYS